jgi:putative NADH-flavin reductase
MTRNTSLDVDLSQPAELNSLTEREVIIAKAAAKIAADMAVRQMTNNFYQEVGKTFVSRWLIIIGSMVVAFALGKGWLTLPIK